MEYKNKLIKTLFQSVLFFYALTAVSMGYLSFTSPKMPEIVKKYYSVNNEIDYLSSQKIFTLDEALSKECIDENVSKIDSLKLRIENIEKSKDFQLTSSNYESAKKLHDKYWLFPLLSFSLGTASFGSIIYLYDKKE